MIRESRAGKLGRFLASEYDDKISSIVEDKRDIYVARFVNELANYSFKRVRASERGILRENWELENLGGPNPDDPIVSAKILKEICNLFFQRNTSYNFMRAFLYHFQKGSFRPILDRMNHLVNKHKNFQNDSYNYSFILKD